MAVGNLMKGGFAGGLASYLLADVDHKGEVRFRADLIGGTVCGDTAREIAQEFDDLHQLRPTLGQHIVHMTINFAPDDRELTDKEQEEIGRYWAEQMGFQTYAIFSHGDHEHIEASRILPDGSVVSDSNDWARSEKIIREIEEKFDLVRVESSHLLNPERGRTHKAAPTMAEIALAEKGEEPAKVLLQNMLDDLLDGDEPVTASQFLEHLDTAGVDVRPNISMTTDKLNGFSYSYRGYAFTSKTLGRSYSLNNLIERGLDYEPSRDLERLREARRESESQQLDRSTEGFERGHSKGRGDSRKDRGIDGAAGEKPGRTGKQDRDSDEGPSISSIGSEESSGRDRGSAGSADQASESSTREATKPDNGPNKSDAGSRNKAEGESPKSVPRGTRRGPSANSGGSGSSQGGGSSSSSSVVLEGDTFEDLMRFLRAWAANYARSHGISHAHNLASVPSYEFYQPSPGSKYDAIMSAAGVGKYARRDKSIAEQLSAFGCKSFEVQAIPPKGADLKPDRIRTLEAKDIIKHAAYFSQKNAKGYDIYVRPAHHIIDGKEHGEPYVFIDDITPAKMKQLKDAGLPLAITMESSPGNFQGWIRVGMKPIPAEELSAAAKIVAKHFGGDKGSADWRHYGRLAGFTNRKPTRRQKNGYAPFVQHNVQAGHMIASSGPGLLAAAREELAMEKIRRAKAIDDAAVKKAKVEQRQALRRMQGTDVFSYVAEARERLRKGEDESSTDFSAALSALRKGFDREDVKEALRAASPSLAERKGADVDRYLDLTLDKADDVIASSPGHRRP